jgi:hypothetical protein
MKGPVHYKCSHCGGDNPVYEYVESIDCHACKRTLKFNESTIKWFREQFPDGVSYRPEVDEFERQIFESIGLSEEERKYISVENNSIYFCFPLKVVLGEVSVGDKILKLDDEMLGNIFGKICQSFESLLNNCGFISLNHNLTIMNEQMAVSDKLQFTKDFKNEEEAREAVRWVVDLKKRLGF